MGHSCRTILSATLVGNSCGKVLWDTPVGHSGGKLLRDTLVGCILVGNRCGTLSCTVGRRKLQKLWTHSSCPFWGEKLSAHDARRSHHSRPLIVVPTLAFNNHETLSLRKSINSAWSPPASPHTYPERKLICRPSSLKFEFK